MKLTTAFRTQNTQDWRTPEDVFDSLNSEFHFDHDPCPINGMRGLDTEWGYSNFVNPPYKYVEAWLRKGFDEAAKGKLSVFLLPSKTGTGWWHRFANAVDEIRFIRGRLRFSLSSYNAPFDSVIFIIRGKQ